VIRLIDLYRIVGRRLTEKLIQARWIVPVQNGPGGTVFEAEQVHRVLGTRLPREGWTLLPNSIIPPTSAQEYKEERERATSLDELVLDAEELAQLEVEISTSIARGLDE
jgi:hypothetical protein